MFCFFESVSSALTSNLPQPFTEEMPAKVRAAKEKAVKAKAVNVPAGTTIMRKLKTREMEEQEVSSVNSIIVLWLFKCTYMKDEQQGITLE